VIASSSRPSFSERRRECRGAICPRDLGRGRASTTGSRTGHGRGIGRRSSGSCSLRSMRPAQSSMVPSFAHIRMRRAEKGGPMQCFGPLSRRLFDQAPRHRRHESAADPHHADAGPASRDGRS